jgi:hypothetical protein
MSGYGWQVVTDDGMTGCQDSRGRIYKEVAK